MDDMEYGDMQKKAKKRYRFFFLTAAGTVFFLILTAAAVLLIHSGVKTQKYNTLVKNGNTYYRAGDYQNAIVEYQKALEVDNAKPDVYLNISYSYAAMGEYDHALAVVQKGLEYIASEELQEREMVMQGLVNTEFADAKTVLLSEEEIKAASMEVTMENTTFDMAAAYTYTEYFRDFGTPTSNTKSGNKVILYYAAMGLYTTYYDLDKEKVLDQTGNMPIAAAKPCSVSFESLRSLFAQSGEEFAVSREKLAELLGEDTEFYRSESDHKYYMTAQYKACKLTIETDESGNIVSESAWNEAEPLYRKGVEAEKEEDGKVSGYVLDAVSGRGMAAAMKVRKRGMKTGEILAELQSGADGSYTYAAGQGSYTVEVSAAGYITEYLDVEIIKGQVKTGANIVLSSAISEGEIRIVLTWGAFPSDLDSHTDGTSSAGGSFHIDYTNKIVNGVGELDVDDTNGYGPETTTLTDAGADFIFRVVYFTESGSMGSSGAVVKVYLAGNAQPVIYTVPQGSGNTWTVFWYAGGTVTPYNTLE